PWSMVHGPWIRRPWTMDHGRRSQKTRLCGAFPQPLAAKFLPHATPFRSFAPARSGRLALRGASRGRLPQPPQVVSHFMSKFISSRGTARVAWFVSLVSLVSLVATAGTAAAQAPDAATLASMRWRSVGPVNMAGRITDVEGDPKNPKVFYVTGATGGIWKTIN